jgi:hypothetical protein
VARPLSAVGPKGPTLGEVIKRNMKARGGGAVLDRMRSVLIDIELQEGGQQLNGHYAASTAGPVRIDIYAGGKNVYAEGIDGKGYWMWTGEGGAKPGSEGGRIALVNGAENHLVGWHRFVSRGHAMTLMPLQLIDGVAYPVVRVRYSTGQTSYFYVDPVSWQAVRRRDERAYHPDADPTKKRVETRFFDFTAVDGVVESHRSTDVDLATGKTLATNRVLSRRVNPDLPADYFDRNRRALAWG